MLPPPIPRSIAATMTPIEWADLTANKHTVCTPIPASPGARSACEICYAAPFAATKWGVTWGAHQPRHIFRTFRARLRRLNAVAKATGLPFAVFANSLGDWLDAELPPEARADFIDAIDEAQHLTILLLTHRPHLIAKLAPAHWRHALPANIWPGATVEHPNHAFRWNQLADTWADTGRAWASLEPLAASMAGIRFPGAAVLVTGGASTKDPSWNFETRWVHEIEAEHPGRVFHKQNGNTVDGVHHATKQAAGRAINGVTFDWTPWPRHRNLLTAARFPQTVTTTH